LKIGKILPFLHLYCVFLEISAIIYFFIVCISIPISKSRRNQRVDAIDRRILDILQDDASVAVATIAEKVGLSTAPCWRRIKRLDEDGVITRRVALLNRRKVNVPMTVFASVKAPRHEADWLQAFRRVIGDIPEIVEAWRLTGDTDYLLRIVVPDVETYDAVYQRMIKRLEFPDINSSIAMEEMKFTTAIPTSYMQLKSSA
jgi:Lrp/AsnC family transcriptional regulator